VECVRELLSPHQHAVTGAQVLMLVIGAMLRKQMFGKVDLEHSADSHIFLHDGQIPAAQTELLQTVWSLSDSQGSLYFNHAFLISLYDATATRHTAC